MALGVTLRGGGGGRGGGGILVLQKAGVHLVCGPLCSSQGEGGGSFCSTEGWSTPGLWFSVCVCVWGGGSFCSTEGWSTPGLWFSVCVCVWGGGVFLFYRRLEYTWSVVLGGGSSCSIEGWSTPCLWFSVGGGVVSVCVCGGGVFLFYRRLEHTWSVALGGSGVWWSSCSTEGWRTPDLWPSVGSPEVLLKAGVHLVCGPQWGHLKFY